MASAGAAALGLGLCVLAAPEIVVGAVVVTGVVVVGVLLKQALDADETRRARLETRSMPVTKSALPKPSPTNRPKPEPKGPDFPPLALAETLEQERRRRCEPIPVPHAGKDDAHHRCADQFPPNRYPGMDVLVDGVSFDALQVGVRVLWEIKTHRFDTYPNFIRDREIENEMKQSDKQRKAAAACGYDYVVGVSTEEHIEALLREDRRLDVVVTGCER